jgi:hypothetical protein
MARQSFGEEGGEWKIALLTPTKPHLGRFQKESAAIVPGPHCRQPHQMIGVEYWLSQVAEPTPPEETPEAA